MKQTVLEITQDILDSMNSFSVSSIAETTESEQVAKAVKSAYFDIAHAHDWASLKRTMQLDSGTVSKPTHLKVPDNVKRVDYIAYNVKRAALDKDDYKRLTFLIPERFLEMQNSLNSTATNVQVVTDFGGVTFNVKTDKAPEYWTTFDDQYVVCDSWNSALETNLQNSKSRAIVIKAPVWVHDSDFVPDLPEEAFPWLLAEAKSRAWMELRGIPNEKAEQSANRHRRMMSQNLWRLDSQDRWASRGRKTGVSRNPYLEK